MPEPKVMKPEEISALVEQLDSHIQSAVAPDKMTKADAKSVLEVLVEDLESSIEALTEEMGEEG